MTSHGNIPGMCVDATRRAPCIPWVKRRLRPARHVIARSGFKTLQRAGSREVRDARGRLRE